MAERPVHKTGRVSNVMKSLKNKVSRKSPKALHFVSSMDIEAAAQAVTSLAGKGFGVVEKLALPGEYQFDLTYQSEETTSSVNVRLIRWNQTQTRVECVVGRGAQIIRRAKSIQIDQVIFLATGMIVFPLILWGLIGNFSVGLLLFLLVGVLFMVEFSSGNLRIGETESQMNDWPERLAMLRQKRAEEHLLDTIVALFKGRGDAVSVNLNG